MECQIKPEMLIEARARLREVVIRTPLLPSQSRPGVFFKTENFQKTGSFKIRAAYNQIARLDEHERRRGIVTSSSGNFAQGAAIAAELLGVSAKIVMMECSSPTKIERTRALGGEVIFCENRFEAREEKVAEIKQTEGRATIHPYNHPDAIAGNASGGLEILEQFPEIKNLIVPVSGGGLISGLAVAMKTNKPSVQVWGVQSAGSNAAFLSFQEGRPVSIEKANTIADGLAVTRPGSITFPLIRQFVTDVVAVSEDSIRQAVRDFILGEKLVVEPSGAVTLAAILEDQVPADNTVCFLSGGNIDPILLSKILQTA
jgi:threonine dehydratase